MRLRAVFFSVLWALLVSGCAGVNFSQPMPDDIGGEAVNGGQLLLVSQQRLDQRRPGEGSVRDRRVRPAGLRPDSHSRLLGQDRLQGIDDLRHC